MVAEVKGGYRVNLAGLKAFMPRSEADPDARISPAQIVDQPCQVVVLEARRKPENIVVSRRKPLLAVQEAKRAEFFTHAAVGEKVTGLQLNYSTKVQ